MHVEYTVKQVGTALQKLELRLQNEKLTPIKPPNRQLSVCMAY